MGIPSLYENAKGFISDDPVTKDLDFYAEYDHYFRKHGFVPSSILEIGVFKGESTQVFSKTFPGAKIVALDLSLREIDFSDCPNVTYLKANQRDATILEAIVRREFPDGVDFVIEDASHFGALSAITFRTLLPLLKSNGVYAIEDWGTGYRDTWEDGSRFQEYPLKWFDGKMPKRIPSHDFGMVGFVKSLVDLTHEGAVKGRLPPEFPKHISPLKSLEFVAGICFAMKS
jgi:hypothetical protein